MRVGALRRKTQHLGNTHVGGKIGATDQRCPRARIGGSILRPAQAKFQQQLAAAAVTNARSFGGDQGLIVKVIEQRGFQYLSHRQRPLDDG